MLMWTAIQRAERTSKQVLPMYGPEGSESEVLQGYRDMGQG